MYTTAPSWSIPGKSSSPLTQPPKNQSKKPQPQQLTILTIGIHFNPLPGSTTLDILELAPTPEIKITRK